MITPIKTLWDILTTHLKKGSWVTIDEIYQTVEEYYKGFTPEDLKQVTPTNKEPTWHRNVRNALQSRKTNGEVLYGGNATYMLSFIPRKTFDSVDIRWIKNVKRNLGDGWAYDDVNCLDPFLLNWPTSKKGSASTPNVGDIIVLFQKPNEIHNKRNYKVHFTHLVTPISYEIILDEDHPKHKWCRRVQLIAKPDPIHSIPNPGYFNFYIPNRGLTNPIVNLENTADLTEAETKDEVWRLFQDHQCSNIKKQIFKPENPVGVFGEIEGDKIVREHIRQELTLRNSSIVQKAKSEAIAKGNGRIFCECCSFDFVEAFGILGTGFIECHHKIPIANGQRITTLNDLALVCSNCHRMLHRKKLDGKYYSVSELQRLIDTRKQTNTH